jgi:hypothetical protein
LKKKLENEMAPRKVAAIRTDTAGFCELFLVNFKRVRKPCGTNKNSAAH